jgi:hypothetical protein
MRMVGRTLGPDTAQETWPDLMVDLSVFQTNHFSIAHVVGASNSAIEGSRITYTAVSKLGREFAGGAWTAHHGQHVGQLFERSVFPGLENGRIQTTH